MMSLILIVVGYCLGVLFPATWLRPYIVSAWKKLTDMVKPSNKDPSN